MSQKPNTDAEDILSELENSEKDLPKEPTPEPEPEPTPEPEPEPEPGGDDPFEGIETDDINEYADLYDVPPPENDNQAKELASKIKKWISNGRPNP